MKIGTQIFSVILVTLILVNSMRITITYAYYELDPIGFIETLCENKDQPELQCNGKCHLKKVSNGKNSNQKTPESVIDFKELIFYPISIIDFGLSYKYVSERQLSIEYQNLYSFQANSDCFHPPKA